MKDKSLGNLFLFLVVAILFISSSSSEKGIIAVLAVLYFPAILVFHFLLDIINKILNPIAKIIEKHLSNKLGKITENHITYAISVLSVMMAISVIIIVKCFVYY